MSHSAVIGCAVTVSVVGVANGYRTITGVQLAYCVANQDLKSFNVSRIGVSHLSTIVICVPKYIPVQVVVLKFLKCVENHSLVHHK